MPAGSSSPLDAASGARPTCYRCFRPAQRCLCAKIPRVDNRTALLVVQHPRERSHPFGTARLLELSLGNLRVAVDYKSRLRSDPTALALPEGAGLLYPHPQARDITRLASSERPSTLVVIDGTWHHARTLYRDIPALGALPHFTLPGDRRSNFRIRRQPHERCLSTLEASVFALQALEPDTPRLGELLEAFRTMVDEQLEVTSRVGRKRAERRARASRAIPRALIEDYGSLIVAYGESVPDPTAPGRRRLVSCAAERPASGERFYAVLAEPSATAAHLAHMGLSPSELAGGLPRAEFERAWARFVRPHDVLGAWNQSTLDLLRDACTYPEKSVLLKAAYFNLKRGQGGLEDVVRHEGLAPRGATGTLRAEQRLGNAVALARLLHRIGTAS